MPRLKIILNIIKDRLHNHSSFKSTHSFLVWCFVFITTASVYFNIRIFFDTKFSYFLGEKKDFTINFFYLSDIFIYLLLFCIRAYAARARNYSISFFDKFPLFITIIAVVSYIYNFANLTIPTISIFYLLYITKWTVLHETIKRLSKNTKAYIMKIIWIFGLFEAFIAIVQFAKQSSIGFKYLGEPDFGPYLWGVAKVEALGQTFARPYGTFPHPNVLAATLLLTLCLGTYYYYKQTQNKTRAWIHLLLLQVTIIALFISFSRAAWLAGVVVIGLFHVSTWNYLTSQKLGLVLRNAIVSIIIGFFLLSVYQPFVEQRGNIFDKAYQERISYNKAAITMIKQHLLLGLGPAESVLHMKQHLAPTTNPWEIQPIHNYFLLLTAEIGLPAVILFISYLIGILLKLFLNKAKKILHLHLKQALLLSGLVGYTVLMFFDHYFYTIQAPMLLLWLWLGLAATGSASNNNKNTTI